MNSAAAIILGPIIFLTATAIYYLVLTRIADRAVLDLWLKRRAGRTESVEDQFAVVNIAVAAVFQVATVALLVVLLDVPLLALMLGDFDPLLLLMVVPLALAELSLASMLAGLIMMLVPDMQAGRWRAMMDAGWLRSFMKIGTGERRAAAPAILLVYIAAEETLFRGIGLWAFRSNPAIAAMMTSLVFVAVQCVGMPSWRHAIFPVAGALVMGPAHALLALAGAPLLFLIAVHLTFFLAAIATAPYLDHHRNREYTS